MVEWVGRGDPAPVGEENFTCLIENVPLQRNHTVFDFGCGIGRTSVMLAEFLNENGHLVGSDIIPGQIQFCQQQFARPFPQAAFYCVRASNRAYDELAASTSGATSVIEEELFFFKYRGMFDVIVAYSVFTHFDPTMAEHYLKSLRDVTKLSSHLLLTWFLDHPSNPSEYRLAPGENFREYRNLGFALFSPTAVAEFASSAALQVERISYGYWRGWQQPYLKGNHYQDVVILRPRRDSR
jgi:SAM-dependent methyltransferase